MTIRLERILDKLIDQHVPPKVRLSQAGSSESDAITQLQDKARLLARFDVVVIAGQLAPEHASLKDLHIQDWVQCHYLFYHLLVRNLFPSYTAFKAFHADQRLPPVIVLFGEATPALEVMAGCVLPYIGLRQGEAFPDRSELLSVMAIILQQLVADGLTGDQLTALREQGADLLRRLLSCSIQHVALTRFDPPMKAHLRLMQSRPSVLPEQGQSDSQILAYELETLPEDDQPITRTQEMFVDPVVFKRDHTRNLPPANLPEMPNESSNPPK